MLYNIISIYKPAGLNRVSDKTLQENDVNVDVYYADIEEGDSLYSNTEMLSLCIKTVDGDGHFGEERVKEITKDYPHGIDEYIVSLMKQDMEKDDDYYEGTYSFSDIYRMRVGKQTWYCYDLEFSSGAVRTRAYAYFGDYINLLESYSDFGTDRARELMHYYVNTIG